MIRRFRMAPLAAASAALVLTACGASTDAAEGENGTGSGFVREDARGKTVELDGTPKTVVAQASAAALWDNGFQVAGVYADQLEAVQVLEQS